PIGRDTNHDRNCLGPGEAAMASDCDDTLGSRSPTAHENCIDGVDNNCDGLVDLNDPTCIGDVDGDGDGYCPVGQDLDGDSDCRDGTAEIGGMSDCDDLFNTVHPGAIELCQDHLDNDCNGAVDFDDSVCSSGGDRDGDGYCPHGRDVN